MELIYRIGYSATSACAIGFAIVVLWKNLKSWLNVTWALANVAIAVWAGFTALYLFETDYEHALVLCRISLFGAALIPGFFLHFCMALINKPLRSSPGTVVLYIVSVILACSFLVPSFALSVSPKAVFRYYVDAGPLFIAFTAEFFLLLIYDYWLLLRHLRAQTSERQNQIKHVAIGTVVGFLCGSTNFLLPYDLPIEPWLSLFIPLYVFYMTYAIVGHHLLDIRIVIRRSVVYSLLIACITAFYLVAVLIMERGFQGFFGYRSFFATVFVAFLIAIFFNPLRNRIQALVDRALFKATPLELADQREQLLAEVRRGEQMKAVGTLAAGLAHEIKNPLAAIKTFTEHLHTHYTEPAFREKFQKIVGGEVERINLIVQQLLDFAKPEPPKLQPIDIPRLLDETLDFLNNDLVHRQVEVNRYYTGSGRIIGDRQQLKQVFLNLFLNSLQAMNGHGRLDLVTICEGQDLSLIILDNGSGILPEHLSKLFEPFFTTKTTGTGLGLAVSRNIIEEHRGRIEIDSKPGQGTRITIVLPTNLSRMVGGGGDHRR